MDDVNKDEAQAPLIGHYHELSFLTDLQIRILVTIWVHGNFERAVRALPSWRCPDGGVEIGPEVIEGRAALDAATSLLASRYLARGQRGYLSMTERGHRVAEIAAQSARTMRLPDSPRGHA